MCGVNDLISKSISLELDCRFGKTDSEKNELTLNTVAKIRAVQLKLKTDILEWTKKEIAVLYMAHTHTRTHTMNELNSSFSAVRS